MQFWLTPRSRTTASPTNSIVLRESLSGPSPAERVPFREFLGAVQGLRSSLPGGSIDLVERPMCYVSVGTWWRCLYAHLHSSPGQRGANRVSTSRQCGTRTPEL